MAIVKMKHLRLMLVQEQKDELLKKLIRLGCVQFREVREAEEDPALESFSPVSTALTALRSKQSTLHNAIELIGRYSPEKTPLLAPKTEVSADILLDDSGIETALRRAEEVIAADDKAKRISAEESRQRSLIEALQPWSSMDLRLEKPFTERVQVLLGTVPLKVTVESINEALTGDADECEAYEISTDRSRRYLAVVCLKEQTGAAQEALRAFSFNPVNFSELKGTPKDCINLAKAELNALGTRKTESFDVIAAIAEHRKELQLAADKLDARIAMAQAEETQLAADNVLLMEG